MKRKILIDALCRVSQERGYSFCSGGTISLAGLSGRFPVAWLSELKITGHEGRHECRAVYHAALSLLVCSSGTTAEEASHRMEADALAIFHTLAEDPDVCRTFGFRCTPADRPLTKHGEYSVSVGFDIETFYYR